MACDFEVGDCVLEGGHECRVIDIEEVGGDYYLKLDSPGGEMVVACKDAVPCPNN